MILIFLGKGTVYEMKNISDFGLEILVVVNRVGKRYRYFICSILFMV